jgi:hypothetical protein
MSNIRELIKSIEAADSSFDEKLDAINKMEETLVAMRQHEEQAVQDNVDLIVEAIKVMENKVTAQLEVAKSIVPEKGDKGDKGDRGLDGRDGKDGIGRDGKDGIGRDGIDGKDGVSVTDAKIDFDGSLIISLSTGQEINVGEVVAPDLAEKIKVISTMSTNGAVGIKDEGTSITGGVKTINFVGATVTATNSGDDVTVNVSAGTGTVTSVAATVPSFLSVAGSPITTSGTLTITLSGTALPIANGGTGATTLAGASIATYTGTETLTNKRIDPRVTSAASASSLTPDISASDVYAYTALAAGLTINAPTGTPLDGDKLIFRLLDNGTSRALTWNGTYTVIGVTLPTATTISKTTYVGCIYNANNTRWDVIAVTTQA